MAWWFRRRPDEELDGEILAHIEMAEHELIAQGVPPDEARQRARRQFGNVTHVKEAAHGLRRGAAFDPLVQDVRHALRRLRARPATAALAVAMLAAAIGMTSAMFTVVDAFILRPAPFRDPATLVRLGLGVDDQDYNVNLSLRLISAWRSTGNGFSAVHAMVQQAATFGSGEQLQVESGARITPGLFEELGVAPLLGRTFLAGEGQPGTDDVVILSERTWRARFGGDPALIGRRVEISGTSALIVGVMPASFAFPYGRTGVWRPLDIDRPPPMGRKNPTAFAYARLSREMPRADITRLATDAAHAIDPATAGKRLVVRPIGDGILDAYSAGTVKVVAAGAALVFLVLCVNVTNLMLTRLSARRREFALCAALGASRGRLLRQALWEQLIMGAAASALGLWAGAALVGVAQLYLPTEIRWRTLNPLDLDLRAVLATSLLSLLAIVIAGVLPAWIATRHDTVPELQMASRGATAERKTRVMTNGLLIAELALAVGLCIAAGIQLRSFVALLHAETGIDAAKLTTFDITLPAARFADGATRYAAAETLRTSVEALPGVEGAALSFGTPPAAGALYFYDGLSDLPGAAPVKLVLNGYNVTPAFFEVYGIQLLEGRAFEPGDSDNAVIVSRSLAAELWPATSAVRRTMRLGTRTLHVIGVAREIRNPTLDPRSDEPELYERLVSAGQGGAGASDARPSLPAASFTLTTRCSTGCPSFEIVRARLKEASPAAIVGPGKHVREGYATALERPRVGAVLAIAFAIIALIAVGAGLFAVLSRAVLQRTREFGIRLALGATPTEVRRQVHVSQLWITAAGISAGAVLAWVLGRVLASVQYEVQVGDPLTWTLVIAVVTLTAFAAAWRPARQAMRVDPMALLREE